MSDKSQPAGFTLPWLLRQWLIITVSIIPFFAALVAAFVLELPHFGWFIAGAIGSQASDSVQEQLTKRMRNP